jgi:outer membrane protein assembly factor BamA
MHPRVWIGVGDKSLPLSEEFSLGGPENFWGYAEDDSLGRQVFLASLEYRYKLPVSLFFDTYFKFRYDFGAIRSITGDVALADFKHGLGATLALDTPAGPVEFSVGEAFYSRPELNYLVCWGPVMFSFSIGYSILGVH